MEYGILIRYPVQGTPDTMYTKHTQTFRKVPQTHCTKSAKHHRYPPQCASYLVKT